MALSKSFAEATEKVSSGALGDLSQSSLLDLYGLYAVVHKGSAPSAGPSAFFDPRGFAKWKAWLSMSHLEKEDAMKSYVELVSTLQRAQGAGKGTTRSSSEFFGSKSSTGFDMSEAGKPLAESASHDICYWATMGNVAAVLHCLHNENVSPDFRDQDGLTPLMRAVDRNEQQVVDVLIDAGAKIDAVDEEGQSALHYAVYCEHADMAGLLVSYAASVDIKDKDGMTPLEASVDDTKTAIMNARAGSWKRKTERYRMRSSKPSVAAPAASMDAVYQIAAGVAFLVIAGLVAYRWHAR